MSEPDTSDVPEVGEDWFKRAKLIGPSPAGFERVLETQVMRDGELGTVFIQSWGQGNGRYRIATYAPGRPKVGDLGIDPEEQEFAGSLDDASTAHARQLALLTGDGWHLV